ncbi:MAG: amidohydrolase family protein [Gammaproteobacteria bacterium]|nr:amidohydrolase family protein [Gammaproteobacteria bacterium]
MLTLTHLNIWDGESTLQADAIQIQGPHIIAVGDSALLSQGIKTINCSGLTAMPGLIDAHVHLELNPDDKDPPVKTLPHVVPLMQERVLRMAKSGITTARDLGGGAWYELSLRDAIARGDVMGPRLLCSGQPITSPRGHCHFWGGEAADLAAAKGVLQRQVDHQVDLIKIMATGGRMTKGSEPTDTQFPQQTLNTLVALAHSHNLPVAAHCHGTEGIHRAALAGVNTIEHCSWVGQDGWASNYQDDIAKVILDNGIWVSPTVNKGWQRMLDSSSSNVLGRVRSAYRKMLDMGINMVASTDAGIPGVYHHDLAHALVVFGKIAQLDHGDTLRSATSHAASALGIAAITGRIKQGMEADILLVDGNPLDDITAITRTAHVYCRGRRVEG